MVQRNLAPLQRRKRLAAMRSAVRFPPCRLLHRWEWPAPLRPRVPVSSAQASRTARPLLPHASLQANADAAAAIAVDDRTARSVGPSRAEQSSHSEQQAQDGRATGAQLPHAHLLLICPLSLDSATDLDIQRHVHLSRHGSRGASRSRCHALSCHTSVGRSHSHPRPWALSRSSLAYAACIRCRGCGHDGGSLHCGPRAARPAHHPRISSGCGEAA